jgi:hypothetical protein
LWVGSGLTLKYYTKLERLSVDKHSSLIYRSVGDEEEKKFYNIDSLVSSTGNGRILVLNETVFVEDAFRGFPAQVLENFRLKFQPGFQFLPLPYSTVNSLEKSLDVVLAVQVRLTVF